MHRQEPSEQCLKQPAGNDLEGPMPDSMGLLHKLQYLNLANNTLTSSIPQSIWQLQSLGHLILVCFALQLFSRLQCGSHNTHSACFAGFILPAT